MTKVYVIIKGWGAYSDRGTKPALVYLDQAQAQEMMTVLDAICNKYNDLVHPRGGSSWRDHDKTKELNPACEAEYAAAGIEADIYDDWELAEAELVPPRPMPDAAVTKIMADRLQRFIPDRDNAEGMATALQEDLQELNWRIIPVVGDYIADYSHAPR